MIVVDLGCKTYDDTDSIGYLIDRFHPEILFGFDPHPELEEGVEVRDGTVVVTRRLAAWTYRTPLRFMLVDSSSRITTYGDETVQAFDFPGWLLTLPVPVIVKMDIEGAEYEVLRPILKGADERISLLLIEWHPEQPYDAGSRDWLLGRLRCPVEEWQL